MQRIISIYIVVCFIVTGQAGTCPVFAQDYRLPAPGVRVHLSPPLDPPILKGIKVHPDNPFRFDFILDKGESHLSNDALKDESSKLIKYFLASLTIPENDLWVNLSPYEKDRIIPNSFGLTEMGRDLLAEDYMLKQITASLIYPEDQVGKKFWKRIYEEATKKFGTTNIPVNTFNKVWIVPEKAVVFENAKAGTAYVVESKLKVMLEHDYLSLEKHEGIQSGQAQTENTNQLGSQVVREIVIPELTKEVNEDKNFAKLRQAYNSLILATWYKKKIKDSILEQVYADKNKVAGVNIDDPKEKEKIYQRYLQAFKKGVYNYIKEEHDPVTQETIPRKYFSGGVFMGLSEKENTDLGMSANFQVTSDRAMVNRRDFLKSLFVVTAGLTVGKNAFGQSAASSPTPQAVRSQYSGFFTSPAAQYNPNTGLCISNIGDPDQYAASYDMSLRMRANLTGSDTTKILNTYVQNNTTTISEDAPATMNISYNPINGVYEYIRINNLNESNWWNTWDWSVDGGVNAQIGNAALQRYSITKEPQYLAFVQQVAAFLMSLQDPLDGGLRYGPQGQYAANGDTSFYWNLKSTENNESALYFFDNLFKVTNDMRYKNVADNIYNWLMHTMYDDVNNAFSRGATYNTQTGQWVNDGPDLFATDTTSWAPMERMFNDEGFGATRLERLQKYERMIKKAEQTTGIYVDGKLKGMSFSEVSSANNIISIEWSSQFALRYWRIAQEYAKLSFNEIGMRERQKKALEYWDKYQNLIKGIGTYFTENNGFPVAPYAVYPDGTVAANQDTGIGFNTPSAYAAVASVYYSFALTRSDPLLLPADQAMQSQFISRGDFLRVSTAAAPLALISAQAQTVPQETRFVPANGKTLLFVGQQKEIIDDYNPNKAMVADQAMHLNNLGGIDFNTNNLNLQLQNSNGQIKFHIDPAMLKQLQNVPGFVPVVINIQPIGSLKNFLGLNGAEPTEAEGDG